MVEVRVYESMTERTALVAEAEARGLIMIRDVFLETGLLGANGEPAVHKTMTFGSYADRVAEWGPDPEVTPGFARVRELRSKLATGQDLSTAEISEWLRSTA